MLTLVAALLLQAEPVVVVVPADVLSSDAKQKASWSRALQSVLEHDLRANGVTVRTEADLDIANWAKVRGASFLLMTSVMVMGGKVQLSVRLADLDKKIRAATKANGLDDRAGIVALVRQEAGLSKLESVTLVPVSGPLLQAWGEALEALQQGDPAAAKKKVAEVVAKWPDFTPAKLRLAELSPK